MGEEGNVRTQELFLFRMLMKISEMNKDQLRNHMLSNGTIHRAGSDRPEWQQAFKIYNDEFPGNRLVMDCPRCYQKVKEWLQKL